MPHHDSLSTLLAQSTLSRLGVAKSGVKTSQNVTPNPHVWHRLTLAPLRAICVEHSQRLAPPG